MSNVFNECRSLRAGKLHGEMIIQRITKNSHSLINILWITLWIISHSNEFPRLVWLIWRTLINMLNGMIHHCILFEDIIRRYCTMLLLVDSIEYGRYRQTDADQWLRRFANHWLVIRHSYLPIPIYPFDGRLSMVTFQVEKFQLKGFNRKVSNERL